jgi:hypothetical protein
VKVASIASIAALALCSVANAQVNVLVGPGNVEGDENVLFNDPSLPRTGSLVQGHTNQTDTIVDFFGAGETLEGETLNGQGGQSRLKAVDGEFDQLSVRLSDPNLSFTSLILNVNAVKDGQITFNINNSFSQTFDVFTEDLDKNGQNFFRIIADPGTTISQVSLTSTVGISDIKQFRIGGIQSNNPVPEPASMAAIATGLIGLAARRRKNRK